MYMQRIIALLVVFAFGIVAHAQISQGTIVYERKFDIARHVQDEQLRHLLPAWQTSSYQMIFKDNTSIYLPLPPDEAPDPFATPAQKMMVFAGNVEEGAVYCDFHTNRQLTEAKIAEKKYIIVDTLRPVMWRLEDSTKIILKHICKKAVMGKGDSTRTIVWYATDIPTPLSPFFFGGALPGAILQLNMNNGDIILTATSISPKVDSKLLKAPVDGELISRMDYNAKMKVAMPNQVEIKKTIL